MIGPKLAVDKGHDWIKKGGQPDRAGVCPEVIALSLGVLLSDC